MLATELMVPFAHWITPEGMPKRFDTYFYLVAAPVEQLALHDGVEAVEGLWIAPQRALREADAGTRTLVFPTKMNLRKLARYRTVAEAVAASRSEPLVTVMPRIERTETSHTLHIPEAAGYGVTRGDDKQAPASIVARMRSLETGASPPPRLQFALIEARITARERRRMPRPRSLCCVRLLPEGSERMKRFWFVLAGLLLAQR